MAKDCPSCRTVAEDSVRFCPGCGYQFASDQRANLRPPVSFNSAHLGVILTTIVMVIGVLIGAAWLAEPSPSRDNSGATRSSSYIGIGETGRLPTGGPVLIATSKEALDDIVRAVTAKDNHGIAEVIMAGRAFAVDPGTSVRVIDSSFLKKRVRVLSGQQPAAQVGCR